MIIRRAAELRNVLLRGGVDGMLISGHKNVGYLTGTLGIEGLALITRSGSFLITDPRFSQEAQSAAGFIPEITKSPLATMRKITRSLKIRRLGFEPNNISYAGFNKLKKGLKGITLIPVSGRVEKLRAVKTDKEIACIKRAAKITLKSLTQVKRFIRPGISEKDLAARLDMALRHNGAEGNAFPTIVASGPNTAKPHARPTARKFRLNDIIMIDIGANYMGYSSDLTRVFFLGRISANLKRAYKIVKEAQEKAIRAIRPGVRASKMDGLTRNYIESKGFGKYFTHSLGHGVGLDVHESPRFSGKDKTPLLKGMVLTVEPGIYLPGEGGVRVEDMVLVTKRGCVVLTR